MLARKRQALIASILIILPASAIAPSLFDRERSPALLAAVDQMVTEPATFEQADVPHPRATGQRSFAEFVSLNVEGQREQPSAIGVLLSNSNRARQQQQPNTSPSPVAASEQEQSGETADIKQFNGRPIRPVRTLSMLVTAYSPDERSCGESADGITASGYSVWTNGMKMVAADTDILPFGTLVSVPGYDEGAVVPVLDRGGAIKGHRLDVLYPTHDRAMKWGAQRLEVTVWEYADGKPSDFDIRYNSASALE